MEPVVELKKERIDSYGRIEIFNGFPRRFYIISAPKLTENERNFAELLVGAISRKITFTEITKYLKSSAGSKKFMDDFRSMIQVVEEHNAVEKIPDSKLLDKLKSRLAEIAKPLKIISNGKDFAEYVVDNGIGYGKIAELVRDENLEEIMVNGAEKAVFVFHRLHGMCKTNILIEKGDFVFPLIRRIAANAGKLFDENHPLLDALLPDGARANATFSLVTPHGHSLTIRKFTKVPLSVIDLMDNGTLSSELAAFLWAMVEGLGVEPMNIIITGGASSGKTTMLNVLGTFMRYSDRVITIEDTLEVDLGSRENWIQMESKPKTADSIEVTMDDLLRNALRMRPDRLIVGEVRSAEAQTMFVAMDTGHRGCLGTLHSNSAREMLVRLKAAPMNVPEMMLPLLELIIVMQKSYDQKKGITRRVKHVAEVSRMDEKVLLSNIFELDKKRNAVVRTDVPSHVKEVLAERASLTKNELKREILIRRRILEWMLEQGIRSTPRVEEIIQQYYLDPRDVLEKVSRDLM